ncbi:hypothetical protein Tco_0719075 [Tanacetum coccineum]
MGRDTIQLEGAVSTISGEYLLEFTTEYGILENLHSDVPGLGETIVDFPEGKVGVYTRFFEFANHRLPLSQFLFDILGHYQIHLLQLSMIGAAKVSNFEINCRVHNIIPTLNLFRVFYIPSFNSGWMSFSKRPRKNTPQCYTKPLDSLKNWNNRFFWIDERIFPTAVDWRASAPRDEIPIAGSYSATDITLLNTHCAPFQRLPENILCLVGLSRNYYLGDDVYPTFLHDDNRGSEAKEHVQEGLAHEIPHVETATTTEVVQEALHEEEVAATEPPVNKRHKQMRRKRVNEEAKANEPPKVLRKSHASGPAHSTCGGKSLAAIGLDAGSTFSPPAAQNTPTAVSDPERLSYVKPQPHPVQDIAQ